MGLWKQIKKGAKKVGKAWEKVDDFVLPAVGFALGGPGGAALGSAAARGIGDGKFNAKATLVAGAKGYAGGQLAGAAGLQGGQGFGALGSSAKAALTNPGATVSRLTGVGGGGASASVAPGGAASTGGTMAAAGGKMDKLRAVGGFLGRNSDAILSGVNMVQGARSQGKADKLNAEALALAKARDAELAQLRQAGVSRLMNTQRPDLSHIYAGSSNAFYRPLRPQSPSMGAETPRGPQADDPAERPYREITRPPMPRPGGIRRMV